MKVPGESFQFQMKVVQSKVFSSIFFFFLQWEVESFPFRDAEQEGLQIPGKGLGETMHEKL